jgi:surface protein
MFASFTNCSNLVDLPQFNTTQVANMTNAFSGCNKLSNASIQNIINMVLSSNVPSNQRNLYTNNSQASPFYNTIFNNSYYTNRFSELTAAGWTY